MEHLELTEEQRTQLSEGSRHISLTAKQREYVQRAQGEEDAAMPANQEKARTLELDFLRRRIQILESAITALIDGHTDKARELLGSRH